MRNSEPACPFCGTAVRESYAAAAIVVGVMTVACGPSVALDTGGADGGSTTGTTWATAAPTTSPTTRPTDTTMSPSTTTLDTDAVTTDSETGIGFIYGSPETGGDPFDCDVWSQDCPPGEKCAAWANDGGNAWNALRCVPVDADPDGIGDPCRVEGSGVSGIDTCQFGAMCFYVDLGTDTGVCVALCHGSEADPLCDDPGTSCFIANDGVLNLCVDTCNPLTQDCDEGQTCVLWENAFRCLPGIRGDLLYGDVCEFSNSCAPGLQCVPAPNVPSCTGASCCTSYCDPADELADESCPDFDAGQTCIGIEGSPYGLCGVEP